MRARKNGFFIAAAVTLMIVLFQGCQPSAEVPAPATTSDEPEQPGITPANSPVEELVVLTYNVLADPIAPAERSRALLQIIEKHDPDILALQEVAPWFLELLMADSNIQSQYQAPSLKVQQEPGGQLILSRYPITRTKTIVLAGRQRRTALMCDVLVGGQDVSIVTTHMESALADGPVRAQQLDQIFALVADAKEAIVLGDFNFGDGEAEENRIPQAFVDVWLSLRPDQPGHTWNTESSPMAKRGSFPGEQSRRIDRILIRSNRYRPSKIQIVGDSPLKEGGTLFPSDHFGLVGQLTTRNSTN